VIIKLASKAQEKAHRSLGSLIQRTMMPMGIAFEEFYGLGSSTYRGQNASAKESDSSCANLMMKRAVSTVPLSNEIRRFWSLVVYHTQILPG